MAVTVAYLSDYPEEAPEMQALIKTPIWKTKKAGNVIYSITTIE